jgi:probable F420-dependent oxidoreductase
VQIGAVFPQTEIGPDVSAVHAYASAVDRLGFAHLAAYDHVVGADPSTHRDWQGLYDVTSQFHEPMVLFGYLAAVTSLELVTNVLVLPQRQTVLVAKQAAQVDLLTGGRLRLGVGVGWNPVEFVALGADFATRGRRLDEQIALLRRLWCEQAVTHDGAFEVVVGAGLAPRPRQQPIPIWIGAQSPAALRRAGRLGDGWFPLMAPGPNLDGALAHVHDAAVAAGRDPASIGMEGRIHWRPGERARFEEQVGRWQRAGATHISVSTMNCGFRDVAEHVDALARVADILDLPRREESGSTTAAR